MGNLKKSWYLCEMTIYFQVAKKNIIIFVGFATDTLALTN